MFSLIITFAIITSTGPEVRIQEITGFETSALCNTARNSYFAANQILWPDRTTVVCMKKKA